MHFTSIIMLTTCLCFRSARAFTRSSVSLVKRSATARFMSTPVPEDEMPFYALGTNLALQVSGQGNLKTMLDEKEMDIVLTAFTETMKGTSTMEPNQVLGTYGQKLNEILQERTSNLVGLVKNEGAEYIKNFMDCNDEAILTDSGMVYCRMTEGSGKQPSISDTVEVHYHGTLTDGTVFDSSVDRGQTISFPLSGVIKGWQEGLQLMKEGEKATLVIPSDLAYGDQGSGGTIPPGATLKFEVELFKVQ